MRRTPTPPSDPLLQTLHNDKNAICISDRVTQHDLYPFVTHTNLIDQILQSICKGDSVLVVGPPGTGKRTLSLGLARQLDHLRPIAETPRSIYSRLVYNLSLGSSFWNAKSTPTDASEIDADIRRVFQLVEAAGPEKIVLCIDDIDVLSFVDRLVLDQRKSSSHTSRSASSIRINSQDSYISTENMLRYLLFNKKVLCLCTCIEEAYNRLVQVDTFYDEKFTNSFRVLHMQEPTASDSFQILRAHRLRIETNFGVKIVDDALRAAVLYANAYITHRAMPEKALDLMSEACKLVAQDEFSEAQQYAERSEGRKETGNSRGVLCKETAVSRTAPMVCRTFVDNLIEKWCDVPAQKLRDCLETERYLDV